MAVMTIEQINIAVADTVEKLMENWSVKLTVKWSMKDDLTRVSTWIGVPQILSSSRVTIGVVWDKEKERGPQQFPISLIAYHEIKVEIDRDKMPFVPIPPKTESNVQKVDLKFVITRVETWGEFLNEGKDRIDALRMRIREAFAVSADSKNDKIQAFNLLMDWVNAAASIAQWDEPDCDFLVLGRNLLHNLRMTYYAHQGYNTEDITRKMVEHVTPDDPMAIAVSKLQRMTITNSTIKGRKQMLCYNCKELGHTAKACPKKSKDFQPRGAGGKSGSN